MAYKDVRKTLSKKDCECSGCKKPIRKGDSCVVDPKLKLVYHIKCEPK